MAQHRLGHPRVDDPIIAGREPQGDGTIAILGRSPRGEALRVVIGWHQQDTPTMWQVLRAAAQQADSRAAALAARTGRSDQGGRDGSME